MQRPPNPERKPRIVKSTVEARQGRRGMRIAIIPGVSLALLGIAYFILHGYYARTPHQTVSASPRPILSAATPVATPTTAPAITSLSQ